jgi:hypothetical protein
MVFCFFGKEYQIYGDGLITDEEASQIYEKLLAESNNQKDTSIKSTSTDKKKSSTAQWRYDESALL